MSRGSGGIVQIARTCYHKKYPMTDKQKQRTYGRNRSKASPLFTRKGHERQYEREGVFFLKLAVFLVLSTLWVRLSQPLEVGPMIIQAIPVGLVLSLLLVLKIEKYQFNRKIWYVMLILMAILTSFTPVGVIL